MSAPLELSAAQKAVLEQHVETLRQLGFDFEFASDGSAQCVQVPIQLAHKNYAVAVQQMLDELCTADSTNIELEATKSIACQSAIKNGMPLSQNDIEKLLSEWLSTPRNDTCPHGRPVVQKFTMDQLFQLFHPA
jgi:DNA mismatch repair protein MutL